MSVYGWKNWFWAISLSASSSVKSCSISTHLPVWRINERLKVLGAVYSMRANFDSKVGVMQLGEGQR